MSSMKKFMKDKYGFDAFSLALLFLAVLLDLLNLLPLMQNKNILGVIALFPLAYCVLRAFSGNIPFREKENRIFLRLLSAPFGAGDSQKKQLKAEKKLFKYFKCPNCKQKVRVPKGKGKVEILCPRCACKFIKKS